VIAGIHVDRTPPVVPGRISVPSGSVMLRKASGDGARHAIRNEAKFDALM